MIAHTNTLIDVSEIRVLSILQPWKSIAAILLEWWLIICCVCTHKIYPSSWVYLIVWLVISTRLYALYSLIHEAIHFSITRNKKWNDVIGQFFLGFPLLISLSTMRKAHLAHHKYLQTELDPEMKHLDYKEFQFPKTKMQLVKLFLLDISGVNFVYYKLLKLVNILRHISSIKFNDVFDLMLLGIYFLVAYKFNFVDDLILYWLIPFATLYQLLNRIRLSTEHFNIDSHNNLKTRSVIPSFVERCIFTPYNLGYHTEHHLYPGVPFYNLPKLNQALIKQTDFLKSSIIKHSYIDVFKDFTK